MILTQGKQGKRIINFITKEHDNKIQSSDKSYHKALKALHAIDIHDEIYRDGGTTLTSQIGKGNRPAGRPLKSTSELS